MKMDKVKVGVIGTGIGSFHIRAYQKLPDVEVVAVVDLDPKRAKQIAQQYNIPRYFIDYSRLLKLDIDAVSVCTPNFLHSEMTLAALKAGKHVLCEKPMAINAQDAEEMVKVARETGKKLMIAFCNRFRNHPQLLKRYIEDGELGEIYYAKTRWLRRKGIPGMGGWFTTKAMSGGGPLIDLGVHVLDLMLWLMGNPRAVSVTGATYNKFGSRIPLKEGTFDVEDLACAFIRLEMGTSLFLEVSWASHIKEDAGINLSLFGTKGGAELWPLRIYTEKHGCFVDVEPRLEEVSGYEAEIAHFVDCIVEDKEPMATPEQGLEVTRILDAIYSSAETGREVVL